MMGGSRIDDRDWSAMTLGQRIQQLEVEGFVVLPGVLSRDQIAGLKAQTATWETNAVAYSAHQRTRTNVQFSGGPVTALIAHAPTLAFLREALGDDIVFMHFHYAISEPGHPGIMLHTDAQPYGTADWGFVFSAPRQVRVLYYLDDLTPDVSPFWVVPRSHLSMHPDANPYKRYPSHPEEAVVPVRAGAAVVINLAVFHGDLPNVGDRPREMLAISYRPAWCGPVAKVMPWPEDELPKLPDDVRKLFSDPNRREFHRGSGMPPLETAANPAGISPSRWDRR